MANNSATDSVLIRYAWFVIFAAAAIILSWFGFDYFEQELKPNEVAGNFKVATFLSQPKALLPINLIDQNSKPFTLDNLRDNWTFLAIGYTSCPDICPTLMSTFKSLASRLTPAGGSGRPTAQFVFISVDPERDTPQRLADYVRYFNPYFLAATSTEENLRGFTSQLGLFYRKVTDGTSSLNYLIDHSAAIMLINPNASLNAIFTHPHDVRLIIEDFNNISAHFN